jgi:amino acid transporter
MPGKDPDSEQLIRRFTMAGLWIIIVNGLVGAGIFGVPAEAARLTGIYSPLMFLGCGVLMLPIILSFGEVSSYFRGTGGPILYIGTAFGPMAGFQSGWALYVSRVTAFGANANLLVSSIAYFWAPADEGLVRVILLALICGSLTWVNVIGVQHAMRSLTALTILKIVPLVILIGAGLSHVDGSTFPFAEVPLPGRSEIGTAALVLMYAYVGFEGALVPAGEARNPARDMPRALLLALVVVTIFYVAIQAISVAVLPGLASSDRPLIDVGAVLFGPVGALLIAAGVVASVGGNIAAAMLSAPRMTYAMARHRSLPAWFGEVNERFSTPANSVIFYGVASFVLAVSGSFVWLAGLTVLTRLLIYVLSIATIPYLRIKYADATDRFVLPGGYLIPLLGIAFCIALLTQVSIGAVVATAIFLLLGAVFFALARRR